METYRLTDTKDASIGAVSHEFRIGRSWVEATVAGTTLSVVVDGQLSLPPQRTGRHQRLCGQNARVVDQVASGRIIRTIQHQIVSADQLHRVLIIDLHAVIRHLFAGK